MASTQLERTELAVPASSFSRAVRAALESISASLLLFLMLPVFIAIALAIKLSGPGPVFYVQDRVGRGGQLFRFVKFRTMIPDAESLREEVLGTPDDEMVDRYRNDPRITKVGHVLRRWSVDELPQLFNVVRGDMSLVGPRPLLPSEVELLAPQHHLRHRCRPGLTGLWQISGRKETSWEERMDLDIEYVQTKSWRVDLAILTKTLKVVLKGDGAY